MEQNRDDELSEIAVKFGENLTLDSSINHEIEHNVDDDDDVCVIVDDNDDDDDEEEEEEGEFEFSFAGGELPSPVSADDAFLNGQIRPVITFADEAAAETSHAPPVKRLFVVSAPAAAEEGEAVEGEYCAWSPAVAPATEMSRKSNSTGFSRLWRVKDLLVRSHSDGKDTFVFLPSSKEAEKKSKKTANLGRINVERRKIEGETTSRAKNVGGEKEGKKGKKKAATTTASVAAYEALYGNKERRNGVGGGRGKSYLPYRQDLVGLFTNVNGFTRNVHPY